MEDTCPEPQRAVIMIKAHIRQLGAQECPCSKLCCSERALFPSASPAGSYTGVEREAEGRSRPETQTQTGTGRLIDPRREMNTFT